MVENVTFKFENISTLENTLQTLLKIFQNVVHIQFITATLLRSTTSVVLHATGAEPHGDHAPAGRSTLAGQQESGACQKATR